ncbi:MAG: hypothetical protein J5789_05030 [Oscillospiraceae bacterium]|nr:hypothetical protein [Oscillospiraceae bacterium]
MKKEKVQNRERKSGMKRKVLSAVIALVLAFLLLFPFRMISYDDGGSKEWSAALWQVKSKHKIVSADGGFEVGKCVTLLFGLITVYDDYDEGRISVD